MNSGSATRPPVRFRKFFVFGALFELLLIMTTVSLPSNNLSIEITNFSMIVHFPLLVLMQGAGGPPEIALLLVVGFLIMASIWAFLFLQMTRLAAWLARRLNRTQKAALMVLVGIGSMFLLTRAVASILPQNPVPFESSAEINTVVEGNNAFALDLYQKLRAQPGNLFFSPFSISSALAMTSAGASGQTESEMTNTLHLNLPPEKLHPAFQALIARIDRIQRWNRIILKCANSLWCQKDHPFVPGFLKVVHENYSAEARLVDFMHSPGSVADKINDWVNFKTDHKISSAIGPDTLDSTTKMVLGDAIYFKGKWLHQFKEKDTRPEPFHVTTNETVTVPMMHQRGEFKYVMSEDYAVQMLELPYSGQDLSMVILMPSPMEYMLDAEHNDVFDLEQKLTSDNLHAWLTKLDHANPHKTSLGLPRFTTEGSFNLVNELKALGMTSAFDDRADFSGMDGTTNLFLSDVIHKTFVKVDEAGTEAAAVSLVVVKTKGMDEKFYVDRPFIFLIRDNGSGSILFLGRIIDPTK